MYDEDLIDIAFEAANEIGLQENVNEGTLAMLGGPTFTMKSLQQCSWKLPT